MSSQAIAPGRAGETTWRGSEKILPELDPCFLDGISGKGKEGRGETDKTDGRTDGQIDDK